MDQRFAIKSKYDFKNANPEYCSHYQSANKGIVGCELNIVVLHSGFVNP
jgi:hypothetical protein